MKNANHYQKTVKVAWLNTHTQVILKSKNAITLISLVITIIILLILAGISLNLVLGEDGIVKRAISTRDVHSTQEALEKIKLAISSSQIAGLGEIEDKELRKSLKGYFGNDVKVEGDYAYGWTVTVPKQGVVYNIDPRGTITNEEQPVDNSGNFLLGLVDDLGTRSTIYLYANPENTTAGQKITITMPNGETKDIKAVAKTDTDKLEIKNSANYATYTVSKNGSYKFTATNPANETCETTILVKNIEKFAPIEKLSANYSNDEKRAYSYKGANVPKGYFVDTRSNVDTGLVITDSVDAEGYSTGNEWVWVPVNSEVGNDEYYYEKSGKVSNSNVYYKKCSKHYKYKTDADTGEVTRDVRNGGWEPGLSAWSDFGEAHHLDLIYKRGTTTTFETANDVAKQYVKDYEDMTDSVDKYEGFYIGRYELAEVNGVAMEQPGDQMKQKNWYELYSICMNLGKENTVSGMMYGTLWDATMEWLYKSNYIVSETRNSMYSNTIPENITVGNNTTTITVKKSGSMTLFKTGQTSYTKSNNIYDLSGNYEEWTQEAGENYKYLRGLGNNDSSSNASYANNIWGYPMSHFVTRAHFFIK